VIREGSLRSHHVIFGCLHIDCHVMKDGNYCSVPYQLVKQQLEVRLKTTYSS